MLRTALRPALSLFVFLSLLTGLMYPLAVTGIGAAIFPARAAGSLIVEAGKPIGSRLIGQEFTQPRYFWGRPSATAERPYNPLASAGTNQGPLNPALVEAVRARIAALRTADPDNAAPVPVDLVTASASGLDPHISIAAANYQAGRVAKARAVERDEIEALIRQHARTRWLGFLGEPRVNVLELNLALDAVTGRH